MKKISGNVASADGDQIFQGADTLYGTAPFESGTDQCACIFKSWGISIVVFSHDAYNSEIDATVCLYGIFLVHDDELQKIAGFYSFRS